MVAVPLIKHQSTVSDSKTRLTLHKQQWAGNWSSSISQTSRQIHRCKDFFFFYRSLGYLIKVSIKGKPLLAKIRTWNCLFEWFSHSPLHTWQYCNQPKPVCIWLRARCGPNPSGLRSSQICHHDRKLNCVSLRPLNNFSPQQAGLSEAR